MSIYAGLVNLNKALSVSATTPAALAGGTAMYVTIPWPSYSTIERIIVTSDNTFSAMTVSILSDGAAYRAASTANQQQYILDKITQTGGAVQWFEFTVDSQARDNLRAGYCYLLLAATFTTGATFRVTVEGYARTPISTAALDYAPYKEDKNFKVMRLTSGDTLAKELTRSLGFNEAPSVSIDVPVTWSSTNDTLYIGSDKSFSAIEMQVYEGTQPNTSRFTWQYFHTGTGLWTTFTPLDNTSDGQATPARFNYSGVLSTGTLTGWGPCHISTDPMKVMMDEVNAGTRPPMGMAYNPPRYWIRATPTAITGTIKLGFLRTLNV